MDTMSTVDHQNIESVLQEERIFPPPAGVCCAGHIKSEAVLKSARGAARPETVLGAHAEELHWFKTWDTVLKWDPPHAEWFGGGKINVSYNCLDRHLATWRRNKAALIWEGEPGETRTFTYQQLHTEVCKFANVLKSRNIQRGDRVALYMPLIPELAIRHARLRAHRRDSLRRLRRILQLGVDRSHHDASCKLVVTATAVGVAAMK
jgi:acetyl-CoA synthetase